MPETLCIEPNQYIMSYTSLLYQIVFCPKYRNPCLIKKNREKLFGYMRGTIENHNCKPFVINGIEDHLHILTHIHQTVPIASLVKDIKISSNKFIKEQDLFPEFACWQSGYSVFSYSYSALDNLFKYVQNQEKHHYCEDYRIELMRMLDEGGVSYDERYLFD